MFVSQSILKDIRVLEECLLRLRGRDQRSYLEHNTVYLLDGDTLKPIRGVQMSIYVTY
jgi:hypothetical protein